MKRDIIKITTRFSIEFRGLVVLQVNVYVWVSRVCWGCENMGVLKTLRSIERGGIINDSSLYPT